MLIADGVIPSNEGRGYVLRRIIRRALRYGRRLEIEPAFFYQVAQQVPYSLEPYFPTDERKEQVGRLLHQVLLTEETQFSKTMSVGVDRVGEAISEARLRGEISLTGPAVFRLYDTFGVPLETIEEIAADEGVRVDVSGFERELSTARERSKGASKFEHEGDLPKDDQIDPSWTTEFRGYPEQDFVSLEGARVLGLLSLERGERVDFLERVMRAGSLRTVPSSIPRAAGKSRTRVSSSGTRGTPRGTRRGPRRFSTRAALPTAGPFFTFSESPAVPSLSVSSCGCSVHEWTRRKTQANHTGTHLLHAALRQVLGESVRQMGSLVAPDRLRFDYAASRPTTVDEIREIERLVNEEILRDREVGKAVMSMDEAKRKGAIMFFGEKYGERVRVVDVPGFSTELCGGCHVGRTGEIGAFKVLSDKGLAAGVRRIEARHLAERGRKAPEGRGDPGSDLADREHTARRAALEAQGNGRFA